MSKCVKVRVLKGTNLIAQDWVTRSSDPYVVLSIGENEFRTKVVKHSLNPIWDEEFIFSIIDADSCLKLKVWDKDNRLKCKKDDLMGEAEIDLNHLVNGDSQIVMPTSENCFYKNSYIEQCADDKRVQEASLKLREVASGVVDLQLEYPA